MQLSFLSRPEYLLRPGQALKRLIAGVNPENFEQQVTLPWNLKLKISTSDELGSAIYRSGIYDLCLTELLWRLTPPGGLCIDVGANIGYATSIVARCAGKSGTVYCFEPHPGIFAKLIENLNLWHPTSELAKVIPFMEAVSIIGGNRPLNIPPDFRKNNGMCHLYEADEKPEISAGEITVKCTTLDDFLLAQSIDRVDLLKVDTEGHELPVLAGAKSSLEKRIISNIIFEDSRGSWRTPAQLYDDYSFLRSMGYSIYRIKRSFFGPALEDIEILKNDSHSTWNSWEPPNFVATYDSPRTTALLKTSGWYSLLNRAFKANGN